MEDILEVLLELIVDLFADLTELAYPQASARQQKWLRVLCVIYVLLYTACILVGIALLVESPHKSLGVVLTVGGSTMFVVQVVLTIIALSKKKKRKTAQQEQPLYNDILTRDADTNNAKQWLP